MTAYSDIEAQYVFLVCDSKGNKYVFKNAATWQNHDNRYEIHKIDSAGNGSLFHVTTVAIRNIAIDSNDTEINF